MTLQGGAVPFPQVGHLQAHSRMQGLGPYLEDAWIFALKSRNA